MGYIQPPCKYDFPIAARIPHHTHIFSDLTQSTGEGSIILELSTGTLSPQNQQTVRCISGFPHQEAFHLSLAPLENKITVNVKSRGQSISFALMNVPLDKSVTLRVTFAWSQHENSSFLTAEDLTSGDIFQAEANISIPLSTGLLTQLLHANQDTYISKSISLVGASKRMEPIGIPMAISHGALVETPTGETPIQHLKIGDMVQTLDNGVQPIRWVGSQTVPALGEFCPLQMRTPYHFIKNNVLLHAKQRILIQNSDVEYLFGHDSVLIETHHLIDKVSVIRKPNAAKTHRMYHILLDAHEIIRVSGCHMESLFLGGISNDARLLKTTVLRDINPDTLPHHTHKARPFLQPYEAMVLRSEMEHYRTI